MSRRKRYYDPGSGPFTQQDPIGIAGGANVYGFVDGDPINYQDPFGLCGPATLICARIAVLAMTRLVPAATSIGAAMTGLSGRHGGAAHRARVAQVADDIVQAGVDLGIKITAGGGRLPERAVAVAGGRIRFPDIIAQAADGTRVFINVGRQNLNGTPVAREVRALEDLAEVAASFFLSYNKP